MSSNSLLGRVVAPVIFAILAMGLFAYQILAPEPDALKNVRVVGLLLGLLGGFVSIVTGELRIRKAQRWLRVIELVVSPLGALILVPVSPPLAGGYLLGSVATFGFCLSLKGLFVGEPSQSSTLHSQE
jgi:hypothetical protein